MYVSLVLFLGHLYLVADQAGDAALAERDDARLGARGLGARGTAKWVEELRAGGEPR